MNHPEEKIQKKFCTTFNEDAIECMKKIDEKSIELIAVDLPYGVTNNKWDSIIPIEPMWEQFKRILKDNGAIVLTATQPFASKLIMSNLDMFKYDLIWEKTISSGQLNVAHQPMRSHESILVFYKNKPTYNEQLTKGEPYSIKRKANYKEHNYADQKDSEKINTGYRHARSVIKISNPRIKNGHPTQKPIELMEYIIKTYSKEGDTVFDCCMGSGTTGEAALINNRNFIGIELDNTYYTKAVARLKDLI